MNVLTDVPKTQAFKEVAERMRRNDSTGYELGRQVRWSVALLGARARRHRSYSGWWILGVDEWNLKQTKTH